MLTEKQIEEEYQSICKKDEFDGNAKMKSLQGFVSTTKDRQAAEGFLSYN